MNIGCLLQSEIGGRFVTRYSSQFPFGKGQEWRKKNNLAKPSPLVVSFYLSINLSETGIRHNRLAFS